MIFYVTVYIDLCWSPSRSLIIGSGSSQINRLLHAPVLSITLEKSRHPRIQNNLALPGLRPPHLLRHLRQQPQRQPQQSPGLWASAQGGQDLHQGPQQLKK